MYLGQMYLRPMFCQLSLQPPHLLSPAVIKQLSGCPFLISAPYPTYSTLSQLMPVRNKWSHAQHQ